MNEKRIDHIAGVSKMVENPIEKVVDAASRSDVLGMPRDDIASARAELFRMRAELKALRSQVGEYEEMEAGCCPEDVGCAEYIALLRRELAKLRAQDRWISIEAELPLLEEPVWLYMPGYGPFIGCRTDDTDGWLWANSYDYFEFIDNQWKAGSAEVDDDYQPTHWRRLPMPPDFERDKTTYKQEALRRHVR